MPGKMSTQPPDFQFEPKIFDKLMPMAVSILPTGHIGHVGPTISKLRPDYKFVGRRFLEVFAIRRPRKKISNFSDLQGIAGSKLRLEFRHGLSTLMKGVLVAANGGDCLIVNLSFGFQLTEAVRQFGLSNGDFSQTELAIEMLYLIEAKTAVMEESRRLNQRLHGARLAAEQQALTDPLTKLKNRRAMDQILQDLVVTGVPFGLMHVDLDYFKAVNDTLGHAAGDHVLQVAAKILTHETRDCDTVARVGGDEFVLIFEDLVDKNRLMKIASRIVRQLEVPVNFEGKICRISGSIGYTTSTFYDVPDLDQMLSDADVALYASKHKGRACSTLVTQELLAEAAKLRLAQTENVPASQ